MSNFKDMQNICLTNSQEVKTGELPTSSSNTSIISSSRVWAAYNRIKERKIYVCCMNKLRIDNIHKHRKKLDLKFKQQLEYLSADTIQFKTSKICKQKILKIFFINPLTIIFLMNISSDFLINSQRNKDAYGIGNQNFPPLRNQNFPTDCLFI